MPSDELPTLNLVSALRRQGESPAVLQRAARAGGIRRIRRGSYVDDGEWAVLHAEDQHRLLVAATQAAAHAPLTFSHESAAALWGIPVIGRWPTRVHALSRAGAGRRTRHGVVWHESAWADGATTAHEGFRVTTPLQTAIDLSATRGFLSGVVSVEHILYHHSRYGVTREDLLTEVALRRPFRSVRRVDAVLEFSGALSGSALESVSRVRFSELGVPEPEQQKQYVGLNGEEYSADFYWKEADAIGEADGDTKYTDPAFLRGRTPEQALRDEKRREDELRAQCSSFVRWGWDDAWRTTPLALRLARAGIHRLA